MVDPLDELTRLERELETLRQKEARADGARAAELARLQSEHGLTSREEAEAELLELDRRIARAQQELGRLNRQLEEGMR